MTTAAIVTIGVIALVGLAAFIFLAILAKGFSQ